MKFLDTAKSIVSKTGIKFKKHSPAILVGVGIAGFVGTVVLASRETLKLESIKKEREETFETIDKYVAEKRELEDGTIYSAEDAESDKQKVNAKTVTKVIKLYLPAISLGVASAACILTGFHIISARYAAVASAYTALQNTYNAFYNRVKEEYGEEKAEELRTGQKTLVTETGEMLKETTAENILTAPTRLDCYFSPKTSIYWDGSHSYNDIYLSHKESEWNSLLKIRGYVCLADVKRDLGLDIQPADTQLGWVYNNSKAEEAGIKSDNYISFRIKRVMLNERPYYSPRDGITDDISEHFRAEKGMLVPYIYHLDFNYDGVVYPYV